MPYDGPKANATHDEVASYKEAKACDVDDSFRHSIRRRVGDGHSSGSNEQDK